LADSITGGRGNDTLTGGTGKDTFNFAAGDTGTVGGSTFDFDTITDFGKGNAGAATEDSLNIVGTPSIASATALNVTLASDSAAPGQVITATTAAGLITLGGADAGDIGTLGEWVGVAKLVASTNGGAAAFEFGSDTYVFQHNTGGDILIKLTGVSGTDGFNTGTANGLIIN
jgi:Ca2+-binding RTX toxin-like protein